MGSVGKQLVALVRSRVGRGVDAAAEEHVAADGAAGAEGHLELCRPWANRTVYFANTLLYSCLLCHIRWQGVKVIIPAGVVEPPDFRRGRSGSSLTADEDYVVQNTLRDNATTKC